MVLGRFRGAFALPLCVAAALCWSAHSFMTPLRSAVSTSWSEGGCRSRIPSVGASRSRVATMMAEDGEGKKSGWPAFRAFKTFLFYNRPRLFRRGEKEASTAAPTKPSPALSGIKGPLASGVVLVTGATGGVGKRVVEVLRQRGLRVRALARNQGKAQAFFNGQDDVEIVVADIKDPSSLRPSMFKDVVAVVACTAAIVMPREGDSADRAKYYQGIKFYEPTVVDAPMDVDFQGIVNTVQAAKRSGELMGKKIFSTNAEAIDKWKVWGSLDDIVMGGVSDSSLQLVPGAGEGEAGGARIGAVFSGTVSTAVGFSPGGFVSARTRNLEPTLDLTGYDGIKLRVKGDGNRYKFILRDEEAWDGMSWSNTFDTKPGEWMDVHLPFASLIPTVRTTTIPVSQRRKFQESTVYAFQMMLSKFEYDGQLNPNFKEGPFSLTISSIEAYTTAPTGARLVYISSAGVTRPGRPGIKLEEEPPAVRMNDMLGGILTYKLKAEDTVRASGVPYTVIRPCALTEEPRGAEMIVEQGDNIKGKISRDDVAELAVAALLEPSAANKTFEVKSNVPFSQAVTLDETPRDYVAIYKSLKTD